MSLELRGLPSNSSIEGCWKAEPSKLPEFRVKGTDSFMLADEKFLLHGKDSKSLGDLANYLITAN